MKNHRLTQTFLRRVSAQLACAIIAASSAWAQSSGESTPPQPEASATGAVSSEAPSRATTLPEDDVIELSPFQVRDSNRGYQASNTMSGTRLNTKLEDLAASISVVTKEQLQDTAALDINDIFLYEANTEGMGQYTDFTIDRGFYVENTTLNPQSSNRIRGMGSANIAVNNFASTGTVPIDTYNLDSVEISRGANSNIFGLGNASGTVNLVMSQADVTKDRTQIVTRADSYGGWRANADIGRVLWKNRAAIRVSALREEKGFERKPSYEDIDRLNVSFTVKPFKNTTIRGSYEKYKNHFSRANTTLPRDSYTEWAANGRPVWNPLHPSTSTNGPGGWRYLNGSAYTAVTAGNENTGVATGTTAGLPLGLLPGSSGFWARPSLFIEGDGRVSFYGMNAVGTTTTAAGGGLPAGTTVPAPTGTPQYRYVEAGSIYRRSGGVFGEPPYFLYQAPSITDKSIYDWTEVNFLSPNYGRDKADTYRAEIEHVFVSNGKHLLAAQVGQFREVADRYDHAVFSRSDSGTPFVTVDVNEVLIDGSSNPNFLRPYIGGSEPAIKYTDERNTASRASLAYQLDLTQEAGWLKWAGRHGVNIYAERRDILVTSLTGRDVNVTDYAWTVANDRASLPLRGSNYRFYPRYYVGDADTSGRVFDYAPASRFQHGGTPFTWYTPARARIQEGASIQEIIQSGNSKDREIRTKGAIWQGYFWDERIIPTIGWRDDRNRERSSRNLNANPPSASQPTSSIDPDTRQHILSRALVFPTPWQEKAGKTHSRGVVIKPLSWLNLNYNESDSFKAEQLAYNIYGELLDNPTGDTRDYGVTVKLFNDKLIARVTRYKSTEENSRNGSITSAVVTRVYRLFFDPANALRGRDLVTNRFQNDSDAFDLEQSAAQWYLTDNPGASTEAAQQFALDNYLKPLGIDQEFMTRVRTIGASSFTDINTVTSSGTELELTYNPNRYWTMKLTGAQQKAVDTNLGNATNTYILERLAAGAETIVVPSNAVTTATGNLTAGRNWWQVGATSANATGANTPSGFFIQNVKSVIALATANAGKPRTQTREYSAAFTTKYRLAGLPGGTFLKNADVGGAVRWASKAAQGYYGAAPTAVTSTYRGGIIDYDPNRPIYDEPRFEVDFNVGYNLRFWNDKVACRLQLNVRNAFESGRIQPISYNPDGMAWNYRIVDPRQFILTATFDL